MKPKQLKKIYTTLLDYYGHRNWWPAKTSLEIVLGAILTQNTAWKNVEKAIRNLKTHKLLSYKQLSAIDEAELAPLIRSSGYYNQKAKKVKAFLRFLEREYRGSIKKMFDENTFDLREKLLTIKGIGCETADSILLYAGDHPVFVVDLYTYRILTRHQWIEEEAGYEDMREFFERRLPLDVDLYKDFHAQLVAVGNQFCRKTAQCEDCPLRFFLP